MAAAHLEVTVAANSTALTPLEIRNMTAKVFNVDQTSTLAGRELRGPNCTAYVVTVYPRFLGMLRCLMFGHHYTGALSKRITKMTDAIASVTTNLVFE